MHLREEDFRAVMMELMDENPFAVRSVLRILEIRFTEQVKTLAVTCEERPVFKVNLKFVNQHCHTDEHVKALICHEFLHVLLNHTEKHRFAMPLHNLAFDAVINAIIHRTLGEAYSSMMETYYRDTKMPMMLLRPIQEDEKILDDPIWEAWQGLYSGKLVADDILEIIKDLQNSKNIKISLDDLLGGHTEDEPISEEIREAIQDAMKEMNGDGIWRSPRERGVGTDVYKPVFLASEEPLERWRRKTMSVLRSCLIPDKKSRLTEDIPQAYRLPVLNEHDKRAFMQGLWSPFIPDANWESAKKLPQGTANIYLDVSGSMNVEMPFIVALLNRLRSYIRMPFWVFSDVVAKAKIVKSVLEAETTGGTSMNCVLEHIAKTKPKSAVIVTDGYIEVVDMQLLKAISSVKLHVLISREGSAAEVDKTGIPYTQLERLPS
jgi:hypothetical protein